MILPDIYLYSSFFDENTSMSSSCFNILFLIPACLELIVFKKAELALSVFYVCSFKEF